MIYSNSVNDLFNSIDDFFANLMIFLTHTGSIYFRASPSFFPSPLAGEGEGEGVSPLSAFTAGLKGERA